MINVSAMDALAATTTREIHPDKMRARTNSSSQQWRDLIPKSISKKSQLNSKSTSPLTLRKI